jgi:hypothetical protein
MAAPTPIAVRAYNRGFPINRKGDSKFAVRIRSDHNRTNVATKESAQPSPLRRSIKVRKANSATNSNRRIMWAKSFDSSGDAP